MEILGQCLNDNGVESILSEAFSIQEDNSINIVHPVISNQTAGQLNIIICGTYS